MVNSREAVESGLKVTVRSIIINNKQYLILIGALCSAASKRLKMEAEKNHGFNFSHRMRTLEAV